MSLNCQFFFFKQKTAYEMRISDWSSDVCSSDLDVADVKYKEGDRERFVVCAQTTDKLLVFATNGRFYTLGVDKLPGGRGFGEPLRLMMGLPNDQDIVDVFVHQPGRTLLVDRKSVVKGKSV